MKRVQRAVREVERDLKKGKNSRRRAVGLSSDSEMEEAFDNIVFDLQDSVDMSRCSEGCEEKSAKDGTFPVDDLPDLPRDWKVKLREKVLRNMEASIHDIHIRCEVSEGGLDLSHIGDVEASVAQTNDNPSSYDETSADDRAFALGFTLESFVVRTANEKWEAGSHDKRNAVDGTAMSSVQGHLGPNGYVVKNNKIGYFSNFSIYWDDEPPLLLAETDVLRGNYKKLSPEKIQSRVAGAMDAMFANQEPGKTVRQSLSQPLPR